MNNNIDNQTTEQEMHNESLRYKKRQTNLQKQGLEKMAEHIHINLEKMSFDEKINLLKNIISEDKLNEHLLEFELHNFQNKIKYNNLNSLVPRVKYLLERYHPVSGNLLEDEEWNIHTYNSKKYELGKNEIIFDNSIKIDHSNDEKTMNYIKTMTNLFSSLTDQFTVRYKYIDDKDEDICWIIIKIK